MADLEGLLKAQVGRKVTPAEISTLLGYSTATFYRREATTWPASELITIAERYGLSPTRLLLDMEVLSVDDVRRVGEAKGIEGVSDLDLLNELLGRALDRVARHGEDAVAPTREGPAGPPQPDDLIGE